MIFRYLVFIIYNQEYLYEYETINRVYTYYIQNMKNPHKYIIFLTIKHDIFYIILIFHIISQNIFCVVG